MTDEDNNASGMGRRTVLQTAGVAVLAGLAAGSMPTSAVAMRSPIGRRGC